MKITKINRTVFEIWIGILIFSIPCQIVALFIPKPGICSLCLWIGIVAAFLYSFHLWWSLNRAFELDEASAAKSARIQFLLRYLFLIIVLTVSGLFFKEYVLATFVGITGTKIGAYLQPLTKKISTKIYGVEILPPIIEYIDDEKEKATKESIETVEGQEQGGE